MVLIKQMRRKPVRNEGSREKAATGTEALQEPEYAKTGSKGRKFGVINEGSIKYEDYSGGRAVQIPQ